VGSTRRLWSREGPRSKPGPALGTREAQFARSSSRRRTAPTSPRAATGHAACPRTSETTAPPRGSTTD